MSTTSRIIRTTIAVATLMCNKNHSSLLPTTTKIGIKNLETLIKRKFEVSYYMFRVGFERSGGGDKKYCGVFAIGVGGWNPAIDVLPSIGEKEI